MGAGTLQTVGERQRMMRRPMAPVRCRASCSNSSDSLWPRRRCAHAMNGSSSCEVAARERYPSSRACEIPSPEQLPSPSTLALSLPSSTPRGDAPVCGYIIMP